MRGQLFIVAAPSGAGKSSLVNAVLARTQGICLSISYTSRGPRPGERHAQHYHFVGKEEFERMVAAGDFFEHALVHGDYKGTRGSRWNRSFPPARTCCWKSTGRARARCASACPMP
jgi:guanylate kinase